MATQLKAGDVVRYKDGCYFSNGKLTATVDDAECVTPGKVWLVETGKNTYEDFLELVTCAPAPNSVADLLQRAGVLIGQRGKSRDDSGNERSMARTVAAFNAMTGHSLTEEEGWLFMRYLKDSRARKGEFNRDDYEDGIAYAALQAEAAINS